MSGLRFIPRHRKDGSIVMEANVMTISCMKHGGGRNSPTSSHSLGMRYIFSQSFLGKG